MIHLIDALNQSDYDIIALQEVHLDFIKYLLLDVNLRNLQYFIDLGLQRLFEIKKHPKLKIPFCSLFSKVGSFNNLIPTLSN